MAKNCNILKIKRNKTKKKKKRKTTSTVFKNKIMVIKTDTWLRKANRLYGVGKFDGSMELEERYIIGQKERMEMRVEENPRHCSKFMFRLVIIG